MTLKDATEVLRQMTDGSYASIYSNCKITNAGVAFEFSGHASNGASLIHIHNAPSLSALIDMFRARLSEQATDVGLGQVANA